MTSGPRGPEDPLTETAQLAPTATRQSRAQVSASSRPGVASAFVVRVARVATVMIDPLGQRCRSLLRHS